jgi:rod shape-determining protein MreD
MNNRWRTTLFIALAVGQFAFARYYYSLRFTIDLLFLVIFIIAIRSGFMTSILSAALIGFCSDYLTGGVMGVFSFSRTLAAFSLNSLARYLDLKKNIFIFLLILFSLFLSNLAASGFLILIFQHKITVSLLVFQPLSTALLGTLLLGSKKAKSLLDVS